VLLLTPSVLAFLDPLPPCLLIHTTCPPLLPGTHPSAIQNAEAELRTWDARVAELGSTTSTSSVLLSVVSLLASGDTPTEAEAQSILRAVLADAERWRAWHRGQRDGTGVNRWVERGGQAVWSGDLSAEVAALKNGALTNFLSEEALKAVVELCAASLPLAADEAARLHHHLAQVTWRRHRAADFTGGGEHRAIVLCRALLGGTVPFAKLSATGDVGAEVAALCAGYGIEVAEQLLETEEGRREVVHVILHFAQHLPLQDGSSACMEALHAGFLAMAEHREGPAGWRTGTAETDDLLWRLRKRGGVQHAMAALCCWPEQPDGFEAAVSGGRVEQPKFPAEQTLARWRGSKGLFSSAGAAGQLAMVALQLAGGHAALSRLAALDLIKGPRGDAAGTRRVLRLRRGHPCCIVPFAYFPIVEGLPYVIEARADRVVGAELADAQALPGLLEQWRGALRGGVQHRTTELFAEGYAPNDPAAQHAVLLLKIAAVLEVGDRGDRTVRGMENGAVNGTNPHTSVRASAAAAAGGAGASSSSSAAAAAQAQAARLRVQQRRNARGRGPQLAPGARIGVLGAALGALGFGALGAPLTRPLTAADWNRVWMLYLRWSQFEPSPPTSLQYTDMQTFRAQLTALHPAAAAAIAAAIFIGGDPAFAHTNGVSGLTAFIDRGGDLAAALATLNLRPAVNLMFRDVTRLCTLPHETMALVTAGILLLCFEMGPSAVHALHPLGKFWPPSPDSFVDFTGRLLQC
jgi:hypothetical protein